MKAFFACGRFDIPPSRSADRSQAEIITSIGS